jgi:murein L,D-transpeptidase YafK
MRKRTYLLLTPAVLLLTAAAYAHWPSPALPADAVADAVLVEKSARRLTLLRDGQPLKTYRISLGRQPVGPKEREGDRRTPEGR